MNAIEAKAYKGKNRIYKSVKNYSGILRMWTWNSDSKKYEIPLLAKSYMARKKIRVKGEIQRKTKYFFSLAEAREWQISITDESDKLKLAGEVIDLWVDNRMCQLAKSTQQCYRNRLPKLQFLRKIDISNLNPTVISEWIIWMKSQPNQKTRQDFHKELDLLKTVLNWYLERSDEQFLIPIKKYHYQDAIVPGSSKKSATYMSPSDSNRFISQLNETDPAYGAAALVQLMQVFRASEVYAMKWSNLDLENRVYYVREHVVWIRSRGSKPFLKAGTKTKKHGYFTSQLRSEVVGVLTKLKETATSDLIFHEKGELISFRKIQYRYDRAMKAAGLPYRGTHILRHSGATSFLEATGDQLALQQHGGWSDVRQAMHYGKILNTRVRDAIDRIEKTKEVAEGRRNQF